MHFMCYDYYTMKKLPFISFSILFTVLLTVSCASTKSTADGADKNKKIEHPRTYILNPYEGAKSITLNYNEYYYCYESKIDMWSYLKKDKPITEDKVIVRGRFKSSIAIPCLTVYLEDNSYEGNYCSVLSEDNRIMDIQPGSYFDLNLAFNINKDSAGGLSIVFSYDGINHGMADFMKVGKKAVLTFEEPAPEEEDFFTTNTNNEVIELEEDTAAHTYNIHLEQWMPFIEIATHYPVVNGVEDMTMVDNYQAVVDLTPAFNGKLPRKGDTVNITWAAYSDVRLRNLYVRPVDCSAEAGGWRELLNVNWDDFDDYIVTRSIKSNEPFTGNVSFVMSKDTVAQFCLCIWYDIGDAWPNGPAIIKKAR